ncbi:MAG: GNAT family N-acetyltransferase, partial [Anaerolineae bacterium]|nr:GNAT family N-acetyltransferase [Anaerolineae bacterium]
TLVSYERALEGPVPAGHAQVHIRPARPEDLDVVEQIDAASFPPLWRYPRAMLEVALRSVSRLTVAEIDRRPVGYELSTLEGDEGQVVRLAVLPEYRRQAIGSQLLAEALAYLRRGRVRRLSLNTQGDNLAAQKLYERFGFRRIGEAMPVLEKAVAG